MTPIQLHKRLDALGMERTKRVALRAVAANALGFAWLGSALIIPLLIQFAFDHQYAIAHYATSLWFGVMGWLLILRVLNDRRPEYWPRFANWVYGSYAAERDILGDQMDLDYVFGNRPTIIGLIFLEVLESNHSVTFNGQQVIRILPLTIGNSANPKTGGIYVRTRNNTHQLGLNWFIENLDAFELEVPLQAPFTALKGNDWLEAHMADVMLKLPRVLEQWYVGRQRTIEQLFI